MIRPLVRGWFAVLLSFASAHCAATELLDVLVFGDPVSEQAHAYNADLSDVIVGGLREPARRLLPRQPANWEGGRLRCQLKVDAQRPTYVTVKFWGSDRSANRLILFADGKQIGYRHLGDIDNLDNGTEAPLCAERFYYTTTPLPVELTRGKQSLSLEIRSTGRIWGYGTNWEQYQKTMTEPSRGLYRVYTHMDGAFVPPAAEPQGQAPAQPPRRAQPGPEVMKEIKERLNREIEGRLKDRRPLGQMPLQFLARAYWVKECRAYQNPQVLDQALTGLDNLYRAFVRDPKLAQSDPATPNASWFGLGVCGQVISLLREPLLPRCEELVADGGGKQVSRRQAYAQMLVACRDWHQRNRRQYTNQSMINDLYGIYWANRGLAALGSDQALPEAAARRYLRESVGLEPWLGSDSDSGPTRPLGDQFYQLTKQGLTRELGYVGNYGEVLDWAAQIYAATRPTPTEPGDEKIKAQLVKITQARAAFRYPALDADGFAAMRMETVVGWRDTHYPGDIAYAQRPTWDGTPVEVAAATLDPHVVAYAQQMFADNQFFAAMAEHLRGANFRIINGLLTLPDDYAAVAAAPSGKYRLPMTAGQPDFVFADVEDGVVAIKNGDEILYVSLYWRARHAINFLARVHAIGPRYERIATVRQTEEFEPSGLTYTRPDWVNFGFANGGMKYPGELHSAHAGEQLPIAKIPAGVPFKPGQENLHAGRASFYQLRYGKYLIGLNASADKTYTLTLPTDIQQARELVSGQLGAAGGAFTVKPGTTAIWYWRDTR